MNNGKQTFQAESEKKKSFLEAVTNRKKKDIEAVPMLSNMKPKIEGGNVVVQIDEREYQKAVNDLQFSVIGCITVQNRESLPLQVFFRKI